MQIIRNLNRARKFRNPVVAIGVFDGLHLGHRKILKSVVKKARDLKGTSVAITFYPHPQKEYDIYSLEHRLKLLEEIGIDACFVVSFNKSFENMQPEEFIRRILVDKIAAKYIFVGDNFVFGKRARGNIGLLKDYSSLYGFKVKAIKLLNKNKKAISSTLIRKLIRQGKLRKAEELLGRRVSILGRVVKGFSLGRRIGFPTANVNPRHDIIPAPGIYAVKVYLKGKEFPGVCYIGNKPTFKIKHKRIFIEAHLFNFKGNLYGRELEIKFIRKIRGEQKFSSIEGLARQIKKDVIFAKKIISSPQ